jgi:acetoin utilization deacetylase AcuC-like enzyme
MDELVYFYPEGHAGHFEIGHPERPERVEAIRTALGAAGLWDKYRKLPPLVVPPEILSTVHSPAYLNLLELTCRRGGHLDADTYTTPQSWQLAHNATGGAIAVASTVWESQAQRGFALTRPPGHHATHGQGMGFCLLNNIAITAEYLIQTYHVSKIAIVDLDLHHGNGSQDIFWSRDDVFYVSTHQSPFYPGTGALNDIGEGSGEGWTANFPLSPGSGDLAFNTVMDELILPLLDIKAPNIVLVSYGFDPHWMDPLGQLQLTANGYSQLVQKLCSWADHHCDGRVVLFLEGGYDLQAAQACSLAVTSALLGQAYTDPYPCPYRETSTWQITIKRAHEIWKI